MSIGIQDIGALIAISNQVTDTDGNPIDPTTIVLTVQTPDGTTTTPALDHEATGLYSANVSVTMSGVWAYRWATTGAAQSAAEGTFYCRPTLIGSAAIVSLDQVKDWLNIPATKTNADEELLDLISALTDVIEGITGPILPRSVDEWYDGGSEKIVVNYNPIISLDSITEAFGASTVWTLTEQPLDGSSAIDAFGYTVDLIAGTVERRVGGTTAQFARGRRNIHIQYTAGRATVPYSVRQGMRELLRYNYQPKQGGNRPGVGGNGVDASDAVVYMGFLVPKRVMQLLQPHVHSFGIA